MTTEAGLAEALCEVVKPVIGACLLMRPDDPRLAHPRLGVAVEVANAVVKHLALHTPIPADRAEEADAMQEALEAICQHGVERDSKWAGMTARDIARATLAAIDAHLAGAVAEGEGREEPVGEVDG